MEHKIEDTLYNVMARVTLFGHGEQNKAISGKSIRLLRRSLQTSSRWQARVSLRRSVSDRSNLRKSVGQDRLAMTRTRGKALAWEGVQGALQ